MNKDHVPALAVGLLSVIAGILFFRFTLHEPTIVSAPSNSETAPALSYDSLSFDDLDGHSHQLTEWKKPLQILNFWAPWCAPCRREIPTLIELQDVYAQQVEIIGLAFDNRQNVSNFRDKFAFNYPLLLVQKDSAQINRLFGNVSGGLPYTVILDNTRNIVFQQAGEISHQQLENAIRRSINPDIK